MPGKKFSFSPDSAKTTSPSEGGGSAGGGGPVHSVPLPVLVRPQHEGHTRPLVLDLTAPTAAQGGFDGRGQQTASPMLTAIMSGGVGISGRESANTAE